MSTPRPHITTRLPRSWPVLLLAAPAFVAIWGGWVGLGGLTGFGMVNPLPGIWDDLTVNSAITLPIGVETYAAYALRIWLSHMVNDTATRFAKWSALGSLALGAAGQVAYHLMVAAGMTHAPWQITAVVACLPVAVLGMGAALAHLVMAPGAAIAGAVAESTTGAVPAAAGGDDASTGAPAAPIEDPAPGYRVRPDARVEPVEATDDGDATPTPPMPAPRTAARRTTGRSAGASTATKVARLRRQHPDWTLGRIAEKAGCTERTVRRHLNAPATPTTDTPPPEVTAVTDVAA